MIVETLKDKIPPHNEEAEEATLGALLLDSEALTTVLRYLRAGDFYKSANQKIFQAIINLFNRNEAIDLITVTDELKAQGNLDAVGGAAYISRLTSVVPTSANVEYYAQIVQACSVRRNLTRIASKIVSQAHDESLDIGYIIEEAERQIFEIAERQHIGFYHEAKELLNKVKSDSIPNIDAAISAVRLESNLRDLIRLRLNKIISMASLGIKVEKFEDNLTIEELVLFNLLTRIISEWLNQLKS